MEHIVHQDHYNLKRDLQYFFAVSVLKHLSCLRRQVLEFNILCSFTTRKVSELFDLSS